MSRGMIHARELTRDQAATIIRESPEPVRSAVGKTEGQSWVVQAVCLGQEAMVQPFDLLKCALACLQTAGIPYTMQPREA